MRIVVTRHIIIIIDLILFIVVSFVQSENLKYTNEFVLHVNEGEQAARSLAVKYQLIFERQVKETFFFVHSFRFTVIN